MCCYSYYYVANAAESKGNLENVATLTCGSGVVAGSGMSGTDPFTRVSVEEKPALY